MGWLRRRSHTLKVIHDKLKFQLSQRNALEFIEPWNFWAFSISPTLHFSDPLLSEIHIDSGESFSLTCIFSSNSSFIFFSAFSAIIDFRSSIWALFRAMCLALLLDIRAPKNRVEVCCRILFYFTCFLARWDIEWYRFLGYTLTASVLFWPLSIWQLKDVHCHLNAGTKCVV